MNVPSVIPGAKKGMLLDAVGFPGAEKMSQHSAGRMSGKGMPPRSC